MTVVAEAIDQFPVRVEDPARSVRGDLRAVRIVWQRELIRFRRDRMRIVVSLLQPLLFLFVLGTGLSSMMPASPDGVGLRTFLFPGVLSMAVMFTALFSAASVVWDREFGFLREMLVAPVRRGAIVLGKCLGGATVATFQGVVMLAFAGAVGVPYSPTLLLTLVVEMALLAFALTALGVMVAARIRSIQSFMALNQMIVMPMFFLSGALFPLSNLPSWLTVLTRLNPLTYAVDPMRRAVFSHLDATAPEALRPGVTWWDWPVPTLLELLVVLLLGLAMFGIATIRFRKAD
ncbi:MAG: ABC transporter permease [Sporichthyaceae bacterium]|nr:ABC transporter permease [Sporichthyaceae bacterium]